MKHTRVAWNLAKAKEFYVKFSFQPEYPPAFNQGHSGTINSKSLFAYGYNPSLLKIGERKLMAYRYHPKSTWETQLAIAELGPKFSVIENKKVTLTGISNEDPRLFEFNGEVWIAYVESAGWNRKSPPKSVVRYGKLVENREWLLEKSFSVEYGKNDFTAMEKNWVPFVYEGMIHFIYQISPSHIVIRVDGDRVIEEYNTECPQWRFGQMKGGSCPFPTGSGKWVRAFHSRLDNEPPPIGHRYYVGTLEMNSAPPFEVTSVNETPRLFGSELDSMTKTERNGCRHWKGNVVFPSGGFYDETGRYLSVGVNDCECLIVKL